MSDLSPALRGDLKLYLFLETIAQNVFFLKANPSQQLLGMIVEGLYTAVYMPGALIMPKGDPSDWMGFIGTGGEVSIVDPDEKGRTFTKTLAEGDCLGEIGLLYDTRRTMDVEAVGHCRIHVLSRSTLDRMREAYPKETLSLVTSI